MAAVLGAGAVVTAAWVAGRGPWLGVDAVPAGGGNGIRIASVAAGGPSDSILRAGDRIVAVAGADGPWMTVEGRDLLEEPDTLTSFAAYDRFRNRQRRLSRILSGPVVRLQLASGAVLRVQPASRRPWTTLPAGLWLLAGFGVVGFLIGAAVWGSASAPEQRLPARLLAVSGTGFLLTAVASAVYIERELALEPVVFDGLELANQAGILLFAAAGSALLWIYPRRLTRFPVHLAMIVAAVAVWFNLAWQWHDLPVHNVYLALLASYALAVVFAAGQWRATRRHAIERAALKWLMLSIFLSTGVALVLFFVPVLFGFHPLSSAVTTGGIGLLMFVGLAAGVSRYRLFDLERWWFDIWLWFLAGISVLALDAVFALTLNMAPVHALGFAIILIGWLYLPFRNRIWGLFRSESDRWWERHLPATLERVFASPSRAHFLRRWEEFLRRTFRPLSVTPVEAPARSARVLDDGARLRVPPLGAGPVLDLLHHQRGTRLFTRDDARVADALSALATRSLQAFEARDRGVRRERERIMRELHDDVGARLLTLARRCENPRESELADEALTALRDAIHSLSPNTERLLPEAVADWRADAAERLEAADVRLEWAVDERLPSMPLAGRDLVHLGRVVQECVTNIVKHARATFGRFDVDVRDGELRLSVRNDGVEARRRRERQPGRGLHNIASRVGELGGRVWYGRIETESGPCFELNVSVPLGEELFEDETLARR